MEIISIISGSKNSHTDPTSKYPDAVENIKEIIGVILRMKDIKMFEVLVRNTKLEKFKYNKCFRKNH